MILFEKKKDNLYFCRKILYNKNEIIGNDDLFLREILKLHPEYYLKKGCGIKGFFRKKNIYGKMGFYILRFDGTTTDFSFIKCISNPKKHNEYKMACRNSIKYFLKKFSTTNDNIIHHHFKPFKIIYSEWFEINKNILDFTINPTKDNDQETYFLNNKTSKSFHDYHFKNCFLLEMTKEQHKYIHKNKLEKESLKNIEYIKVLFEGL